MLNTINSARCEAAKVSKGALIYAYNNGEFNYLKMADVAAGMVRSQLGVSTTIVTDSLSLLATDVKFADAVIVEESSSNNHRTFRLPEGNVSMPWYNQNRGTAYDLSPYDQTLLLDSDYMCSSESLRNVFDSTHTFLCFNRAEDVTGQNSLDSDASVSKNGIPMLWATVMYFTRSDFNRQLFEMMNLVRDNYEYYSKLYGFAARPYRNDYALSIAHHTLSGYQQGRTDHFGWALPTLPSQATISKFIGARLMGCEYTVSYNTVNGPRHSFFRNRDLHIMNKRVFSDNAIVGEFERHIDAWLK